MEKPEISIFWFRRDLRIEDNHGLLHALKSGVPVLPIFIFDQKILSNLIDKKDKRISFIHDALKKLNIELLKVNCSLAIFNGDVLEIWKNIIKKYNVKEVFCNEDYEPYALKRDNEIKKLLNQHHIIFNAFKDQCIFAPNEILKPDSRPYLVYTPYKNKWLSKLSLDNIASYNSRKYINNFLEHKQTLVKLEDLGFEYSEYNRKRSLRKTVIQKYDNTRDLPYLDGTSLIGVHLRFGTISIRRCARLGYLENKTWLSELIWREFFMQIMAHFPKAMKISFKEKYRKINWRNNKSEFEKWKAGKTGFPLVDAGMRELNQTGHMHNRVRMVVASFLVKDLLIDWRWGERYFASKLLDYDQCSNNGNWQWCAGTGCDAAPYFRIFNPETQQKKFDPDYKYIKKWVKEFGTDQYPKQMVDHNMAYHRAIRVYKQSAN